MLTSDSVGRDSDSDWIVKEVLEKETFEWDMKSVTSALQELGKSISNTENSWCKGPQNKPRRRSPGYLT